MILVVSLIIAAGCGEIQNKAEVYKYEGPFYSLTLKKSWHMFDFGGDDLKIQGYYRYVTFSKRPLNLKSTNDINDLEYALTCACVYDSSMKAGDFSSLIIPGEIPGVKVVKKEKFEVNGITGRWLESEVQFEGNTNSAILIDIPIEKGYIQIDFFGPAADEELQKEAREIIKSLEIPNPDYFIENQQDEPWRR